MNPYRFSLSGRAKMLNFWRINRIPGKRVRGVDWIRGVRHNGVPGLRWLRGTPRAKHTRVTPVKRGVQECGKGRLQARNPEQLRHVKTVIPATSPFVPMKTSLQYSPNKFFTNLLGEYCPGHPGGRIFTRRMGLLAAEKR